MALSWLHRKGVLTSWTFAARISSPMIMIAADRVRELVTGGSGVCLLVRPALSMRLSASMCAGANVPFSFRSKLHLQVREQSMHGFAIL